jgi:hypothetical protein
MKYHNNKGIVGNNVDTWRYIFGIIDVMTSHCGSIFYFQFG